MTFEHQWSSHYKENDRLPERRGTYLSEFLIFTRTAKAHPISVFGIALRLSTVVLIYNLFYEYKKKIRLAPLSISLLQLL